MTAHKTLNKNMGDISSTPITSQMNPVDNNLPHHSIGEVGGYGRLSLRAIKFGFWRVLVAFGCYERTLTGNPFPNPQLSLPTCWVGQAKRGRAIIGGTWTLNGRTVECGLKPWQHTEQGKGFLKDAHSFDWLWDLRSAGGSDSIRTAQNIAQAWLDTGANHWAVSWRSDVVGRRLTAWLTHFDYFFAQADDKLKQDLLQSMGTQMRHLRRVAGYHGRGLKRIASLRALLTAELFYPLNDDRITHAHNRLRDELSRQILPDGMHIQRCPSIQVQVLHHLVGLRAGLQAVDEKIPPYLQNAIERMIPMVIFFRQQDGGLAIFNHSNQLSAEQVDEVLALADVRSPTLWESPHGGFQRIQANRLSLWMDVGNIPTDNMHKQCAAGALSFNLSHGKQRIIVNTGASTADDEDNRAKLRQTDMQSTLTIGSLGSLDLDNRGFVNGQYPHIWGERFASDAGVLIAGGHHGYVKDYGLIHKRRIFVTPSGDDVRGEDILTGETTSDGTNKGGAKGHSFAIHFHLHPLLQVSLMQSKSSALLRLKNGTGWRFVCQNATIRLEESTYYGYAGTPVKNIKIVLEGKTTGEEQAIKWAFKQEK